MSAIQHIAQCDCGAITISFDNRAYNSMFQDTFEKLFPNKPKIEGHYVNCNHCVNHWGVDLCACGSGERVEECKNGYPECGSPMEILMEQQSHPVKF